MKALIPTTNLKHFFFVLLAAMLVSGCETQLVDFTDDEIVEPELAALHAEITRDLELTGTAEAEVRRIIAQRQQNHRQSGNLWRIASALQASLSDAQKQRLFVLIEQYEDRLAQSGKLWLFDNWVAPVTPPSGNQNCNPQLTPRQLEEVKALRQRFAELFRELQAEFDAGELSPAEFRRQAQALREALQAAYEDVLTDEQLRRMQHCLRYMNQHMHNAAGNGFEIIARVLELDREQAAALQRLQQQQREGYALLLRKLRAEEISRREFIEGIVRLREVRETALIEILDRRQYEVVKIHQGLTLRIMINRMVS